MPQRRDPSAPRRLPGGRRALALAAVLVLAVAAVAQATLGSGGPKPPAKPLATAVHDALSAPPVDGVSARIRFTNRLIASGALPQGTQSPLLAGASGRLWAAKDGRLRLELQSERGDAQIVSDGRTLTLFDASANTLYRLALPQERRAGAEPAHRPPTLKQVTDALGRLAQRASVSGAEPANVAGQPAYAVTVSPKHDAGLLGAASVAWDAVRGTPLRVALTAQGADKPVLELAVTDIAYGPVADGDLSVPAPSGAKVVDVSAPQLREHARADRRADAHAVRGLGAVRSKVGFGLTAPDTLVGLPRREVRLVDDGKGPAGAVVLYGQGLGTLAVLEQPAAAARAGANRERSAFDSLPTVAIDGATGHELSTALGTVLRFERGGVTYTLAGSLPSAAAEAAARGLR